MPKEAQNGLYGSLSIDNQRAISTCDGSSCNGKCQLDGHVLLTATVPVDPDSFAERNSTCTSVPTMLVVLNNSFLRSAPQIRDAIILISARRFGF